MSSDANVEHSHAAFRTRPSTALRRLRSSTNSILTAIGNSLDTRRLQFWIRGNKNMLTEEQRNIVQVLENFVLPPEYDEYDSRWTLKYRGPAPGLEELVQDSGVYVNAEKFAECCRLTKDWGIDKNHATKRNWLISCKRFSYILLTEIFSESALRTCSWSGATANPADIHARYTRPGLNEHARNTLLTYLVWYGQVRDWPSTDYHCILKIMRHILLGRTQYKEIEELDEKEILLLPSEIHHHLDGDSLREEYYAEDSRLTLKYHEPAPGLVELIEHSRVYVNADKLTECKKMSHHCMTLARMLRDEIFTTSALHTFSVTEATDNSDYIIWPGLDEHALIVLLTYVEESTCLLNSEQNVRKIINQKREVKRRFAENQKEKEELNKENEIETKSCCLNLKNLFWSPMETVKDVPSTEPKVDPWEYLENSDYLITKWRHEGDGLLSDGL